ncbi:hypothetical protein M514_11098 [Trichuris suis]|uniref:Uncharacterized protein n=1 Tax=Trichuris suis TaxID=68888 RepID=A0A085LSS0_9BILA|nr:hypothetical protein M513_11098 [Trichuris suis]KFD68837.1 hypothetical protein M514_11098 [Trichuris suis]
MSYLSPLPQYLIPFPRYRTIEPSFTCPTISLPYCDTISRHRRPLLHLIDPSKYCFRAPDTYRQRPVVPHCDKLGNERTNALSAQWSLRTYSTYHLCFARPQTTNRYTQSIYPMDVTLDGEDSRSSERHCINSRKLGVLAPAATGSSLQLTSANPHIYLPIVQDVKASYSSKAATRTCESFPKDATLAHRPGKSSSLCRKAMNRTNPIIPSNPEEFPQQLYTTLQRQSSTNNLYTRAGKSIQVKRKEGTKRDRLMSQPFRWATTAEDQLDDFLLSLIWRQGDYARCLFSLQLLHVFVLP